MLTVDDIMTASVHALTADTTLEDAGWQLTRDSVSGAPVVDQSGKVVGVLSQTDLVDLAPGSSDAKVMDRMTPLVFFVRPADPAMRAVRLMLRENVHRLIVVRDQGRLAGIVTTTDLLRAIERGQTFEEGPPESSERHAEPAQAIADEPPLAGTR